MSLRAALFWDIDGTLLTTARAGIRAWEDAVTQVAGRQVDLADFPTAGLTDRAIARDLLRLAGVEPDDVARIDGKVIRSVDVCDAIGPPGALSGADQRGRRVWTGAGAIPLKAWVDAVRATGFDGTWSCELLSPQHWQLDPWRTAQDLRHLMNYLFL